VILERIKDAYEPDRLRSLPRGNPSGSQFGTCAAQMQFIITKAATPAARQFRNLLTFEHGHAIERWWSAAVRRSFAEPYGWGLQQETFHLPVPIDPKDTFRFQQMLIQGERWGRIIPGFKRPRLSVLERVAADGSVQRRALIQNPLGRTEEMPFRAPNWGFILDPDANMIYAPTQIDFAIWHFELGRIAIVETKSINNRGFRRALTGELGYKERCQLVGQAYATGCDVTMLLFRKETAHLAELTYTKGVDRVHVDLRKMNGQTEHYFGMISPRASKLLSADGKTEVPFPDDSEWEIAQVWTPWDDGRLVEEIQERIRLVLFARPTDKFKREYGPVFVCRRCEGTGSVLCPYCDGTRQSKRSKPKGKLCKACIKSTGVPSTRLCKKCQGAGSREETSLPWQCGYCPVVLEACYPSVARLDLTRVKPRYLVRRDDWERSGLTFERPRLAGRG
jgi:hypothetical protein